MPERAQAVLRLLRNYPHVAPADLPNELRRHYEALQISHLTIYIADLQQNTLVSLPDARFDAARSLPIENSLAGWAYRTVSTRIAEDAMGGLTLWFPLVDGVERLGVVSIQAPAFDATTVETCRSLVALIALIVIGKAAYSDAYAERQRTAPMKLPAEMVWAFLAPRTIGTLQITSSAVIEPAYELGGDAFDHSIVDHRLHLGIFDSMGHDLTAGLTTSVALAACRTARRTGTGLDGIVAGIDKAVREVFPDRYVTCVLANLETDTGRLEWANCGHPTPLLIRGNEVVPGALEREPEPPLGIAGVGSDPVRQIHRLQMEPGDRLLLYSDGVVEARAPDGRRFGQERFADFIIRAMAAGDPPPEVLRRLIHTVLDYHAGRLSDDATIVLSEWHPFAETQAMPDLSGNAAL